jgi:tetratricopeptide (TPR) repeat protein
LSFRPPYHRLLFPLILSGLVIFVLACSTKKNTFTRRVYHNLTSHYNVYWNGRESLKEAELLMAENVKDNYAEVLPVFNYGTKTEAQSNNQKWDRAIQKASIAIQKHSMVFNGKENVKWIDDCYLMIGQAYFYKQEYLSARRTFNFVMREYPDNESKYDAMLWLARTYVQTGEFEKAEPLLNLIANEIGTKKVSYRLLQELPQVYAHHYVQQKKYKEAAEYLYEAISYNPERDIKTRMMFILAQIYEINGDLFRASEMYGNVVKRNPPYDMAFQSKLNMARSFDANSGDSREIVKILNKMLKDDKNKDYKDQIYYALSEVAMKQQDTALAVENLRLSVATSTKNNYQKAKSSLMIADIYFGFPNYEKAQAYYDTAMMFIPKDYPNYTGIAAKTKVLSELVENLVMIQRQDSLQRVAGMSVTDRNAVISNLISEYLLEQQRIAEEERIQLEIDKQENISAYNGPAGTGLPTAGGDWYFYNMTTKDYGYNEFMKKWGKRKYEDLWRLSNKAIVSYLGSTTEEIEVDSTRSDTLIAAANDPKAPEYYLKNLPFTEEAVKKSNDSITEAYFNLGRIYRDGLNDYPESIEAMTTLNSRFPGNPFELQSLYYLYKDYLNLGDNVQADYYKGFIISQYPESDYARVLSDPEYYAKLAAEKNKAEELYEQTWQAYKDGQYFMAIARCDMAFATYGDSIPLAPKFAYIKAISRGKIEVVDTLVSDLKKIIKKYPNSEIKTMSQGLLAAIAQSNPQFDDGTLGLTNEPEEKPSPFQYNPNGQHMFMIVMDSREVRMNPLKVKISDFNQKYYSIENLTINSMVLDNQHYIITVGNFNNASKAFEYYNLILPDEYVYSDLKAGTFDNFLISTENYGTFFKEKDIESYRKFFNKNYQP